MNKPLPRIGLLWTQFAPYHVDRCQAVAEHLGNRFAVLAVEVSTASSIYAWDPSGDVNGATKVTLFPQQSYEDISWTTRLWRQFQALRQCRAAFIGVSYSEPDIVLLAFLLRIVGVHVVMMTESKFDDVPRRVGKEWLKSLALAPYQAAIVGGRRQASFLRFLGFRRRPVVEGYDAVGLSRVLLQGGGEAADAPTSDFAGRPFVFVGRFVEKKAVPFLVDCYAAYRQLAGDGARRLVLVGSGPQETEVRARIAAHGMTDFVDIPGFLQADGVSCVLAGALALVLPSTEEQWGLVVNEALAFSLPAIVSESVGSRDSLVRNLVNGYVIENGSREGFAQAMLMMARDEPTWRRMTRASRQLAPAGDAPRFALACAEILRLADG